MNVVNDPGQLLAPVLEWCAVPPSHRPGSWRAEPSSVRNDQKPQPFLRSIRITFFRVATSVSKPH